MIFRPEINSEIIRWARERASMGVPELEGRFKRYGEWESGETNPTMNQLERLAKALRVPLGYFFLEEPPVETLPVPDYRTKEDGGVERPSPDLTETISTMQRRQQWLREYLSPDIGKLPFVEISDPEDSSLDAANKMRRYLDLPKDWATTQSNWEHALRFLRRRMENIGVVVVKNGVVGNNGHRKLDPSEFRGFVLYDEIAPLIFVNGADAMSAQMFTLAHEFVHLMVGRGGVFDLESLQPADNETERFCNSVAAEFLAPQDMMRRLWSRPMHGQDAYTALSRSLKVSPIVIARRALDLGLIKEQEFFRFYKEDRASWKREKEGKESGGTYYATQNTRVGKRFAMTVNRALQEGELQYSEAYSLTGLNRKTFPRYIERIR